jgi:hypothetical protein
MADRPREFLERNTRTRIALIRDLAEGKMTQRRLAAKYDCTQGGIAEFKARHKEEIEYLKDNLEDRMFGLWIADKTARVAEYQADVEMIGAQLESALAGRLAVSTTDADGNTTWERMEDLSDVIARYLRGKHRALRSVAEERGELPSRLALHFEDSPQVHHVVVGVDVEKVKGKKGKT